MHVDKNKLHVLLLHKIPRVFPPYIITIRSVCIKISSIEYLNFMVQIQTYLRTGLHEICSQTSISIRDFFTPHRIVINRSKRFVTTPGLFDPMVYHSSHREKGSYMIVIYGNAHI